jgi:hypothetical protein
MGWPNRRALEAGIASQEFPAPRKRFPVRASKFPVPGRREFFANPAVGLENLGPSSARRARFPRNSLHFPCISGNWPRRRVRPGLPPPPFSLRPRRLPACSEGSAEKGPRFRGAWRFRSGATEPETADSGLGRRRSRCLSLLPSWAVRFRFRFASAKGGAQQIYQRPDGSRTVHDRATQNESVARNWAGESSASGR